MGMGAAGSWGGEGLGGGGGRRGSVPSSHCVDLEGSWDSRTRLLQRLNGECIFPQPFSSFQAVCYRLQN